MRIFKLSAMLIILIILTNCSSNEPPAKPIPPFGESEGVANIPVEISATTTDPDDDVISFQFDWGNGNTSDWSNYVESGDTIRMSTTYEDTGSYNVIVRAKDSENNTSDWSGTHSVKISSLVIDSPNNLTISGANNLEITFSWIESSTPNVDGYIFYIDGNPFDTVASVSTANVYPPSLGDITLKAYMDTMLSDASNTVGIYTVSGTDKTLYDFDISGQPSGIGWDINGNSTIYNFTTANEDLIDLYLDKDFYLASPDTYVPVKWNTCEIQLVSNDIEYAPTSGYGNAEYPYKDSTYVIRLPGHGATGGTQYLKIQISNVETDTSVTFDYTFQPLEGYTRFQ